MYQTENTHKALRRDFFLCQWCLVRLWIITRTQTGHHILGRARSDAIEDIIALCPKHHDMAHRKEISKEELYAILEGGMALA